MIKIKNKLKYVFITIMILSIRLVANDNTNNRITDVYYRIYSMLGRGVHRTSINMGDCGVCFIYG